MSLNCFGQHEVVALLATVTTIILVISPMLFAVVSGAREDRYRKLQRTVRHLCSVNDNKVTVSDLCLRAEVPPSVAEKFLNEISKQLNGEIDCDENGNKFYRFNTFVKGL